MMLVDAHVHLHECFHPERFLDAAARNIADLAAGAGHPYDTPGMLLFTQASKDDAFGGLRPGGLGRWTLTKTSEAISLTARRSDAPPLILVAGRQIVTAEGLEVLALGSAGPFIDHNPVFPTIDAVRAQHGIPVIPWGFGKWWHQRGKLVHQLAADHARFPLLFLGDNAGRPRLGPRPGLLAAAKGLGRVVLPGTDPLPLPGEAGKAGRLAFQAECTLDTDRPFATLERWLHACDRSPRQLGSYERTDRFVRRQLALQLRKRIGASS